jgi:hypothetical protein
MRSPSHDVTSVFLHSPSEAPDAQVVFHQVPGLEGFAERSLFLARPGDVVCLSQPVDPAYLEFLRSLAIGPRPEDILVIQGIVPGTGLSRRILEDPDSFDRLATRLAAARRVRLWPYFAPPSADVLAKVLGARLGVSTEVVGGPPRLIRLLHDKRFARRLAKRLGIPLAPSGTVRVSGGYADLREAMGRAVRTTGRVIVRGASGAFGSSTFVCDARGIDAAVKAIARRTDNVSYLVAPFFPIGSSPNLEIVVDPDSGAIRVAATEQILNEALVHQGSVHPARAARLPEMEEAATSLAAWMRDRGFRGRAGFDFVETEAGPPFFLTEINPRFNAASYTLALLARLERLAQRRGAPAPRAFRARVVPAEADGFDSLARSAGALLYDPARGEGAIPYTVARLAHGVVGIAAFAQTRERAEAIFAEIAGRLAALRAPALTRA